MPKNIYFTPGPSALYFTVEEHMRSALRQQIPSISHRSRQFSYIYEETVAHLRALTDLPDDYQVFFTASATEIWERLLQSCVIEDSLHLVNGAFSRRFYNMAAQLGKSAQMFEVPDGGVVLPAALNTNIPPELIAITHNETSTGVQQPLAHLKEIREKFPDAITTIDVVSSFPLVELPFEYIDSAYFSVQKCFGLPAGLGVWIINQKTIDRALKLAEQTNTAHHGIASLWQKYQTYQTPVTPNVLSIFLLNKVLKDMIDKGIGRLRMEGKYKAALIYQLMESHENLKPFVSNPDWRSQTVLVGDTGGRTEQIIQKLATQGIVLGSGYGSHKKNHIRIANFPTHSKEQMELLVDKLTTIYEG